MAVAAGLFGCTRSDAQGAAGTAARASAPLGPESHDHKVTAAVSSTQRGASAGRVTGSVPPVGARCVVPAPAEPPAAVGPAKDCPKDPGNAPEVGSGTVAFPDAPGNPRIHVELALTTDAKTRGLMYRTELEDDQGMLFSWPRARPRSFWMKNTCIPLDMLFIDDENYIAGILENVPTLNLAARSVHCPAAHVLEVNAGWTRKHGVFAGQKVEIER